MSGERDYICISDDDADDIESISDTSETVQSDSGLEGLNFEDIAEDGTGFYDADNANSHDGYDDVPRPRACDEFPTTIEVPEFVLDFGTVRVGDILELRDTDGNDGRLHRRDDFLVVVKIFENLESGEHYFKGHRLRRVTHFAPLFDCKLNELVVTIETDRYDTRPVSIQGLEIVPVEQAMKKRDVVFTSQPFHEVSIRHRQIFTPVRLRGNRKDIHTWVHNNGPLIARWVYITIKKPKGKPYGGEIRRMYRREQMWYNQLSRPIPLADNEDDDWMIVDENPFVTESGSELRPQRSKAASIPKRLTFGDFFSGVGGASYGAKEAGFVVNFGVEIDEKVMESYEENHPGASVLCMDAHDFPAIPAPENFFSDHCHFSTTCKYFAICHTRDGKDDQMNVETIYTVGPILNVLQTPYATAEQAPGMILLQKHQKYFRVFLSEILAHGYNIRYKVIDLATLGVPQPRRRLLFNMAKIGYPLAPFPQATHGPERSGLKRFVTVKDALYDLERSSAFDSDPHNQPRWFHSSNIKPPYDPNLTLVKGTLTTSGGDNNYHYSGLRKFTVRENSCFQTFPLETHLGDTQTFANMVVGNAYPAAAAAKHFLASAQTREAFDHGLINAEDDIQDLWVTLNEKGINTSGQGGKFRYLNRLEKSRRNPAYMPPSVWKRTEPVEPLRPRPRSNPPRLINRALARQRREVLEEVREAEYLGTIMVIDDD
ncbi:S-adenosyl-L-methionine-dependent methyltransferase [Periconia macrospinosa]|uniref:DNA (cytosine-5-)-methyltransferase n=1 Tax=Periconia macrospinosa TaxID=97972 RepID=A0A2V1E8A3_9PLEO|nr:S-adenosyl-L-methionine-dependent methyltransferase [Periconia macrospinosa]